MDAVRPRMNADCEWRRTRIVPKKEKLPSPESAERSFAFWGAIRVIRLSNPRHPRQNLLRRDREVRSGHDSLLLPRGIDPIEQELERPMRLTAEGDLGTEEIELSTSDGRFDRRRAALEKVLPPRPTAAQRRRRIEPCHRAHALQRRIGAEPEYRTVVVEDVDVPFQPRGRGRRAVHGDA